MTLYLIMAIVIVLPSLIYKPIQEKSLVDDGYQSRRTLLEKIHIAVCFLFMFYLMAFRGNITTDFLSYQTIWNEIGYVDSIQKFLDYNTVEPGYVLLSILVHLFTNDYYIFLFICSLVILLPIIIYTRYSPYAWLTLFLYITFGTYYQSFNIMRQMMAASIMLIGVKYIYQGNLKKTAIYSIIAASFHGSALLFIPSYFIFRTNTKKLKWWQMILIYGLLSALVMTFYTLYMVYFKGEVGYQIESVKVYTIKNITTSIVLFVIGVLMRILHGHRSSSQNTDANTTRITVENITFVGFILWIVFLCLSLKLSYMRRLAGYFAPFMMLFIPMSISNIKVVTNRRVMICAVVLLGFICLTSGYGSIQWIGR